MPFCPDCTAIRIRDLFQSRPSQKTIKSNLDQLQTSADSCKLCHLFYSALEDASHKNPRLVPDGEDTPVTLQSCSSLFYYQTMIEGLSLCCQNLRVQLCLYVDKCSYSEKPSRLIDRENDFSFGIDCLEGCLRHHTGCGRLMGLLGTSQFMPTRLIEIQKSTGEYLVHVVLGSNIQDRYATLSHCWGKTPVIQSTRAVIGNFMESIPWEVLSKTFRDAIHIAAKLQINYIWIDSLCIIQDDPDDWDHESSKMASVYSRAVVNLAASSAIDGSVGCFTEVHTNAFVTIPQECIDDMSPEHVTVGKWPPTFTKAVRKGPLCRRGWVVQEETLALRQLYFTNSQVFWRCPSGYASDCSLHGIIEPESSFSDFIHKERLSSSRSYVDGYWSDLLERYTKCSLTRADDKFPALSGLAEAFAAKVGYHYATGLWYETLESGLLWRTRDPAKSSRPSTYRAPSWSWAAMDGDTRIFHLGWDCSNKCPLEGVFVDTIPAGVGSFGRIQSATLSLSGRVKIAEFSLLPTSTYAEPLFWPLWDNGIEIGRFFPDVVENVQASVHCLEILTQQGDLNVLVLNPVADKNEFQRIGTGILYKASFGWFDDVEKKKIFIG